MQNKKGFYFCLWWFQLLLCLLCPFRCLTSNIGETVTSYSLLQHRQKGARFPFSRSSGMVSSGGSQCFFVSWLRGWHCENTEPLFPALILSSPQTTLTGVLHNTSAFVPKKYLCHLHLLFLDLQNELFAPFVPKLSASPLEIKITEEQKCKEINLLSDYILRALAT